MIVRCSEKKELCGYPALVPTCAFKAVMTLACKRLGKQVNLQPVPLICLSQFHADEVIYHHCSHARACIPTRKFSHRRGDWTNIA